MRCGRLFFRAAAVFAAGFAALVAVGAQAFAQCTLTPSGAAGSTFTITDPSGGLNGTSFVTFGGVPGTNFTVVSDTEVTVTVPTKNAPTVTSITNEGGGIYFLQNGLFGVGSNYGATSGGNGVNITGTGFSANVDVVVSGGACAGTYSGAFAYTGFSISEVTLGGTAATGVGVSSDSLITATAPAGIVGVADVIVITSYGTTSLATGAKLYTYLQGGPSVSAINPASGLTSGGNQVTITGTGFVPGTYTGGGSATTVQFYCNGTPNSATSVAVSSTVILTATVPACSTAGVYEVVVTTEGGTATTSYQYIAPATPTISGITPTSGPVVGGTNLSISGANFIGATLVTFTGSNLPGGSVQTSNFQLNGDGSITVTSPAANGPGPVNVSVTVTSGASTFVSSATTASTFTYVEPAPNVASISPSNGSTAGGTPITVVGQYFTNNGTPIVTAVTIGGTQATSVHVVSDTELTAVTAAHSAGIGLSVQVTTSNGTGTGVAPSGVYTYGTPAPIVASVTPSGGSTAGGTPVTILGQYFTNLATTVPGVNPVTFAGIAATNVVFVNDGEITAVTPAHGAGVVNVVVSTNLGTPSVPVIATGTGSNVYTYGSSPPTVTGISPSTGTTLGGTAVTITGTNFSGTPQVTIAGVAAAEVTVVNSTTITAVTPAGTGTNVPVVVTTSFGPSAAAKIYSYQAPAAPLPSPPTISSVAPSSGTTLGLTPVTITGTNFTGATSVTFGGNPATNVVVVNATTITALTPAGSGVVSVAVVTPGGTATNPNAYQYVTVAPTVTAVTSNTGTTLGGTSVTITGTNFTGATAVKFGSNPATAFTVLTATTITATTPAGTGTVNVVVTTPSGTGTGTNLFTYVTQSPPTVTAITPNGGSIANGGTTAGGTAVTITGTNFTGATAVTIGGTTATFITVVNSTTITAVTPAHVAGAVNVVVTTPAGTGTGTNLFTYVQPVPTVTGITPSSGPVAGGTAITITGTNFTGATSVTIGGNPPTSVTVVSPTEITAVTPAGTAGPVNVAVTTPAGTGVGTNIFTYVAAPGSGPTVTSISPSSGAPGTVVTITGTGFTSPASVSFGGVPATNVTVVSPTEITAVAPSNTGAVDVTVTTGTGTSPANAGDKFSYTSKTTPTLTLSSSPNPSNYGQLVTFTAKVTGNAPTGTVTFSENGKQLGTATLTNITATSATATFTIASLPVGSDPVTASYGGDANNLPDPTTVIQVVGTPADSVRLHQFQLAVMPMEANTSAQAITGAIDNAINQGFSGSCPDIPMPNGSGFTYCFDGTPQKETAPAKQARATVDNDFATLGYANAPPGMTSLPQNISAPQNGSTPQNGSAPQTMLAADLPPAYPTKPAAAAYAPPREWLAWVDVRGTDFEQNSPGNDLKGLQGNALFGLTRIFSPNFLVGVTTGYEDFNFTSQAYNAKLGGEGPTAGVYAGVRLGHWRLDAGGTWSDIFVNDSSGTASGKFTATRWLGFGGLTGNFAWLGSVLEPSLQVFTLWEHDNAYTDSLGTAQPTNDFDTGRASGGLKISHALPGGDVTLVPYVGFYADYYFTMNSADATTPGVTATPLLQGWAGRATGGIGARFSSGAQLSAGAEYGGIGNSFQIWTVTLRGSVPLPF